MRFGEYFTTTAFVVVADPVGAGFVDCGAEREMVGAAQAVSPGVTRTAVFEVIEAIQSTFMLRMLRSGPDRALRGREATAPIPDSTRSEGFGTARTSAGIQGYRRLARLVDAMPVLDPLIYISPGTRTHNPNLALCILSPNSAARGKANPRDCKVWLRSHRSPRHAPSPLPLHVERADRNDRDRG